MEDGSKLLTYFSDVQPRSVQWIWYPYIPVGKITLLQGEPGDGKSTMMMHLMAEISKGGVLPDGTAMGRPRRILYQCSEDGAKDTIKPRLTTCGADCRNIAFIDEELHEGLTINDERIRMAIEEFRPWLVVIDPIQNYIETEADLKMATKTRKLMRRIGLWASTYDCAFVLIGHLNKNESSKDLYRGLGSIDVVAAARSILNVERDDTDRDIRRVSQIKNNLAPTGNDLLFEIRRESGFKWLGSAEPNISPAEVMQTPDLPKNKHELAAIIVQRLLKDGEVESTIIKGEFYKYHIGEKTMNEVKTALGIKSVRRMRKWYWSLPNENAQEGKDD